MRSAAQPLPYGKLIDAHVIVFRQRDDMVILVGISHVPANAGCRNAPHHEPFRFVHVACDRHGERISRNIVAHHIGINQVDRHVVRRRICRPGGNDDARRANDLLRHRRIDRPRGRDRRVHVCDELVHFAADQAQLVRADGRIHAIAAIRADIDSNDRRLVNAVGDGGPSGERVLRKAHAGDSRSRRSGRSSHA